MIALIALALGPVTVAQTPHTANAAGLIVDYGDGRVSYALVPFAEESITGIDVLRRSGLDLVTVPFGGLGDGVCSIESTGCHPGACRARLCQTADRESPFWQFVRQAADGSWAPAALGASQSRVENGDVDAWIWSGSAPVLPAMSMDALRDRLTVPDGWPTGDEGPVVRTEGEGTVPASGEEWWRLLPAMAVLGGVAMAGLMLVRRTRGPVT